MKHCFSSIIAALLGFVAMGCGPKIVADSGVIPIPITNKIGFAICLSQINDGAGLCLKIYLDGKDIRYYEMKFASQPLFPRTHINVKYSEKMNAIWVHCDAKMFNTCAYYDYETKTYVDGYGQAKNYGKSISSAELEYSPAAIPTEPNDARVIYQTFLGDEDGAL